MDKKTPLLVLIVLLSSITSCVSTGSSKLSQTAMENIIEGSSSTAEVVKMIGLPDVSLLLDRLGINNYINRIMSIRVGRYFFSEDKYEVWTYYRWSYFAVDPLLIPSLESSRISLLIFNSNGICVRKFYSEDATFRF